MGLTGSDLSGLEGFSQGYSIVVKGKHNLLLYKQTRGCRNHMISYVLFVLFCPWFYFLPLYSLFSLFPFAFWFSKKLHQP